jgi:hypothetical protein
MRYFIEIFSNFFIYLFFLYFALFIVIERYSNKTFKEQKNEIIIIICVKKNLFIIDCIKRNQTN